jgi:hypothetical protein
LREGVELEKRAKLEETAEVEERVKVYILDSSPWMGEGKGEGGERRGQG